MISDAFDSVTNRIGTDKLYESFSCVFRNVLLDIPFGLRAILTSKFPFNGFYINVFEKHNLHQYS